MRLRDAGLLEMPPVTVGAEEIIDAHPLVRKYFGLRLRRENEKAWKEGNRRLFRHLVRSSPELPETLPQIRPLYFAVEHGCRARLYSPALRLYVERIQRGDEFYGARILGAISNELAALQCFFDQPFSKIHSLKAPERLRVLIATAYGLRREKRGLEADELLDEASQIPQARDQWLAALVHLGEISRLSGDFADAEAYASIINAQGKRHRDLEMQRVGLVNLAVFYHLTGSVEKAWTFFRTAEECQKELDRAHPLLRGIEGYWYCDFLLDQIVPARSIPGPHPDDSAGIDPPLGETSGEEGWPSFREIRGRAETILRWAEEEDRIAEAPLHQLTLGRTYLLEAVLSDRSLLEWAEKHIGRAVDRMPEMSNYLPAALLARAAIRRETGRFEESEKDLKCALTPPRRGS